MVLIADSGATKTDWWVGYSQTDCQIIQTDGINPFHQPANMIRNTLIQQLIPLLPAEAHSFDSVFFYGAGCTPANSGILSSLLQSCFPSAMVCVESDLLGAARALWKDTAGIACILGTGSNSCLYDGKQIIKNISPLGYILGDEGSGAYLGKRFIGDCLKEQLPAFLREGLCHELGLTPAEILGKVYRQPQANRFLAGITPYIYKYKATPEVQGFLTDCFSEFFRRNVLLYHSSLPSSFVGSIAYYFKDEIIKSAESLNIKTASFIQSPIEELAKYHLSY